MTFFVLLSIVILVLLSVSIHMGAMHSLNVLMARWTRLNRFRVGIIVLVAIIAHLLEIGLFAIALGILHSPGEHGQLVGAYQPGFRSDYYYSAVAYTALGFGDITPTGPLRLFTAIEGLKGLVLIAWTASTIFLAMRRYWEVDRPVKRHCWNLLRNEPIFGRQYNVPPIGPTLFPPSVYIGTRSPLFLTSANLMPS